MPVPFRILSERGPADGRFHGNPTMDGAAAALAGCARHPAAMRPQQMYPRDIARETGRTRDFAGPMQLHARQREVSHGAKDDILCLFHAPDDCKGSLAPLAIHARDGVPGTVATSQQTEAGALEALDQPQPTYDAPRQNGG